MTSGAQARRQVRGFQIGGDQISSLLLLLSAAAWSVLLLNPGGGIGHGFCFVPESGLSPAMLEALLTVNPPSSLALGWALMLVAMMLPTLIAPIRHIHERSFSHRRLRSVTLFVAGYGAIWMAAGSVLLAIQLWSALLAPRSYGPAALAGLIAFVWQCSPLKQLCLNRGHHHGELAAFGWAADRDALGFGIRHGFWCVGSCWALMLAPMLLPQGHNGAMVAVAILMMGERLERPGSLEWRLRGAGKLARIAVAQGRMRLQILRVGLRGIELWGVRGVRG